MTEITISTRSGDVYFCVAKEKGFYQNEGLEVTLDFKKSSVSNLERTIASEYTVGITDFAFLLSEKCRGPCEVRAVAAITCGSIATVAGEESGIRLPKDLEHRRLGIARGGGEYFSLPLFASRAGFDLEKVEIVDVPIGDGPRMLIQEKSIDAYSAYITANAADAISFAEESGLRINVIHHSDYFYNYNSGIVINEKLLRHEPELVRKFLKATMMGFAWAIDHPDEAAMIRVNQVPGYFEIFKTPSKVAYRQLMELTRITNRPEILDNGLGWMSESKWESLFLAYLGLGIFQSRIKLEDNVFTNEFLERGLLPKSLEFFQNE